MHKCLTRYGAPRLSWTDPATGARLRSSRRDHRRYEHPHPGDLVHVDIKKLGRIPDGGGWRVLGKARGKRVKGADKPGYAYLHHAFDDDSRLVYSEILGDERKESASDFWARAHASFERCGITVRAVLADNGSAYRPEVPLRLLPLPRPAASWRSLPRWSAISTNSSAKAVRSGGLIAASTASSAAVGGSCSSVDELIA